MAQSLSMNREEALEFLTTGFEHHELRFVTILIILTNIIFDNNLRISGYVQSDFPNFVNIRVQDNVFVNSWEYLVLWEDGENHAFYLRDFNKNMLEVSIDIDHYTVRSMIDRYTRKFSTYTLGAHRNVET